MVQTFDAEFVIVFGRWGNCVLAPVLNLKKYKVNESGGKITIRVQNRGKNTVIPWKILAILPTTAGVALQLGLPEWIGHVK